MELLLVAERVDAQRALELGLVNEVVEPEQLEDAALRWPGASPRTHRSQCRRQSAVP
jgi:enoyl-CoA hydratase/carnithine racemase